MNPSEPTPGLKRAVGEVKKELEEQIRYHRGCYYNGVPKISDEKFDGLVTELEILSPDSPVLTEVGAPAMGEKCQHKIPMGSLEKCPVEDFVKWVERTSGPYVAQLKYDGISIDLEYVKGKLQAAITRGDGFEGESVTANALRIVGVHKELPLDFTGSLRGEIFCKLETFEKEFASEFANPRNMVSGTVRNRDAGKLCEWFCVRYFDVVEQGTVFDNETGKLQFMEYTLGLQTAFTYYNLKAEDVQIIYTKYRDSERAKLEFEVDGLVVKVDSCTAQNSLGVVGNRPRWATALKFPPPSAKTVLEGVDWQLGLGGRITPVARLSPVQVGGVTIRNATLHNMDYITELGITPGDTVRVIRAGDVIPQVIGVVLDEGRGRGLVIPPKECPECEAPVQKEGKFFVCRNSGCIGLTYGDVAKWVEVMEIDSLGPTWLKKLIDAGWVEEPADLYSLTVEQFVRLDRMGESLATRIVANIQATKEPSLDKFWAGLNIPGISVSRARAMIVASCSSVVSVGITTESVTLASEERLREVPGFGDALAAAIHKGFAENATKLRNLLAVGVYPQVVKVLSTGSLIGKTLCFTGAIQAENPGTGKRYTRGQMQALVRDNGGTVASSVGKGLDYLVIADPTSTSGKANRARDLKVTLLSEDEFFSMIDG